MTLYDCTVINILNLCILHQLVYYVTPYSTNNLNNKINSPQCHVKGLSIDYTDTLS